jgi:hypothetical protein
MDWETPSKEWLTKLARTTMSVASVTNILCISDRELRRLIALYWPDLKPATLEALHKFLCPQRKLYCTIRLDLPPADPVGEPGEPIVVPEITDPDGLFPAPRTSQ